MDWLQILDVPRALSNVRRDIIGDWYRDPWGWPEYSYLADNHLDIVARRAEMSGIRRVAQIDVPKENFATRPAVVMEPIDRLLYQALVDRLSKKLIGGLGPGVFGWRLPRTDPEAGSYSPNETEWKLYRGELSGLATINDCGLKTDIVSCFASIPVDRVAEEVEHRGGSGRVTERLIDVLKSFDGIPGRRGLAQRSKASAALANMFLMRLDTVLESQRDRSAERQLFTFVMNQGGATRWMDDIWIFGRDEAALRSTQVDLQQAARDAELELNMGKTAAFEGDDLVEAALRLQHSAVDEALSEDSPNVRPLEELLDRLISDPQNADRSSIHFALERMRKYKVTSRRDELIRVAPRMPHGADHLARALRDFRWWQDLQEWYLDYETSAWGKLRWAVANLGAMFPSTMRVSNAIYNRFADLLLARPQPPLFALCAMRSAYRFSR